MKTADKPRCYFILRYEEEEEREKNNR